MVRGINFRSKNNGLVAVHGVIPNQAPFPAKAKFQGLSENSAEFSLVGAHLSSGRTNGLFGNSLLQYQGTF